MLHSTYISESDSKKISSQMKNMSAYLTKHEIIHETVDLNRDQTIEQTLTINGKPEKSNVKLPPYNIIKGSRSDNNGKEFNFEIHSHPTNHSISMTLNENIQFNLSENSQLKFLIQGFLVPTPELELDSKHKSKASK